jgi:hypothetical protein
MFQRPIPRFQFESEASGEVGSRSPISDSGSTGGIRIGWALRDDNCIPSTARGLRIRISGPQPRGGGPNVSRLNVVTLCGSRTGIRLREVVLSIFDLIWN